MTIITGIDEKWHESLQILLVLSRGSLNRTMLYEEVRERQRKIISDYKRSKSTCRYWVNSHLKDRKIRELGSLLELAPLGKWIVNSSVGTMWDREHFINNYVCWECRPSYTVLYKLDAATAVTNNNGNIFMNVKCPRCGKSLERHRVTGRTFASVEEFLRFYRSAEEELRPLGLLN